MSALENDCFRVTDALMPLNEALGILKERAHVVVGSETVALNDALGRVLAEAVTASINVPPHDNSAVDGYAVAHASLKDDGETRLPVTARVAAGHPLDRVGEVGEAVRIFTGAPMPDGMDTVFIQEDVQLDGDDVILPAGIKAGANRRRMGEDMRVGDVVLAPGRRLQPQDIGLVASLGLGEIRVYRRLRAAVFSTGDEVADPVLDTQRPGAIFDANRYSVGAMLKELGCEVTDLGILNDKVSDIRSALHDAAPGHDVIVTSGGVSLGEEDHVAHVVESLGSIDFWRLAIKPGRPVALGRVSDTAFVGLPGNPVAAMITFMRVARPLVLILSGRTDVDPHVFRVPAAFEMNKKPARREWVRAALVQGEDGRLWAEKFPRQGSGVLTSMTASAGLVELGEDDTRVERGQLVDFLTFKEMGS